VFFFRARKREDVFWLFFFFAKKMVVRTLQALSIDASARAVAADVAMDGSRALTLAAAYLPTELRLAVWQALHDGGMLSAANAGAMLLGTAAAAAAAAPGDDAGGRMDLAIRRAGALRTGDIAALVARCGPAVVSLELAAAPEIGDCAVRAALAACRGLERLAIHGCPAVTDAALDALAFPAGGAGGARSPVDEDPCFPADGNPDSTMPPSMLLQAPSPMMMQEKLHTLELSRPGNRVSPGGLARLAGSLPASLRVLRLTQTSAVDDAVLRALAATRLAELDLSGCAAITDAGLRGLVTGGPLSGTLRRVSLNNCRAVTGAGICALFAQLRAPEALAAAWCPTLTDDHLATMAASPAAATLAEVNLALCTAVTDAGVAELLVACHALRSLIVRGNPGVTAATAEALRQLVSQGTAEARAEQQQAVSNSPAPAPKSPKSASNEMQPRGADAADTTTIAKSSASGKEYSGDADAGGDMIPRRAAPPRRRVIEAML
jgi:hypothetical protein